MIIVETSLMAKFAFIVRGPDGRVRKGHVAEKDEPLARKRLMEAGFEVLSLTEKSDLVVHQAKQGRERSKPQRAAIIDFDETPLERLWSFLDNRILRRETAMVLAVVGFVWLMVASWGKPEKKLIEPEYSNYKITVKFDSSDFDCDRVMVTFPDLPISLDREVKEPGPQTEVFELETHKSLKRVNVDLYDGTNVVAEDVGELSGPKPESLAFQAELRKVKSKN